MGFLQSSVLQCITDSKVSKCIPSLLPCFTVTLRMDTFFNILNSISIGIGYGCCKPRFTFLVLDVLLQIMLFLINFDFIV